MDELNKKKCQEKKGQGGLLAGHLSDAVLEVMQFTARICACCANRAEKF